MKILKRIRGKYGKITIEDLEKKNLCKDTNEYVWVEGYKGTDKNMCCHNDFQYELGVEVSLPEDEEPVVCKRGFHFCTELKDVFYYYRISKNHRFFKCKALIKKEDAEKGYSEDDIFLIKTPTGAIKKMVAKKIILTEEIKITIQDCIDWAAMHDLTINKNVIDYILDKGWELTVNNIKIAMFELCLIEVYKLLGDNCSDFSKIRARDFENSYCYFNALFEVGYNNKEIYDKMVEFTKNIWKI